MASTYVKISFDDFLLLAIKTKTIIQPFQSEDVQNSKMIAFSMDECG
jgi:hypothetical protein